MPIALGTAQLGLDYGVSNRLGKPCQDRSDAILQTAWDRGILYYDTAQGYGNSEHVLGNFSRKHQGFRKGARLISKIDPAIDLDSDSEELVQGVERSLKNLGCDHLFALLLHRESQLEIAGRDRLSRQIEAVKADGSIRYFGVSCYSPSVAEKAIGMDIIDGVQIPASVFDDRWIPVSKLASEKGKELFIRSVYLQGLALMPASQVPGYVPGGQGVVEQFANFCDTHQVDRDHFALAYIQNRFPDGIPVLGAESPGQVQRNCDIAVDSGLDCFLFEEWERTYTCPHPDLVDPSRWNESHHDEEKR